MAAFAAPAALAISAIGSIQGGVAEKKASYRQAAVDEENGRRSLQAGEQDAFAILREGYFETDAAAAQMAGSGLAFGGSISAVLANSAEQVEMDIDRVRERARNQAANSYAQAKERRKAGKQALLGGMFNALSTTIGGISDMRNQRRLEDAAARERATQYGGGR